MERRPKTRPNSLREFNRAAQRCGTIGGVTTEAVNAKSMEEIVALCKRRGFVYPAAEIYGGINGVWDYGPLGGELKNNVRDARWRDGGCGTPRRPGGALVGDGGGASCWCGLWIYAGLVRSCGRRIQDVVA